MKKITTLIAAALLTLALVSCRGYDMGNGRYDYYNDRNNSGRRSVGEMVDDGINKAERGIDKGFNMAERGFESVTGINNR